MEIHKNCPLSPPRVTRKQLPKRDHTVHQKICLLGDFSVGKTSLARRFLFDFFDEQCLSTIGVRVSRKTVAIPDGQRIAELTLMLWDVSGSHPLGEIQTSYLRGARGAVLVCDLTRPCTLKRVHSYTDILYQINPQIKLVLAGNKYDLTDQQRVTPYQIEKTAAQLNGHYYLTSAKTGAGVEALFRHLARNLLN